MRSKLLPGKRGIFVIGVLFLVVLVSMFVGAAFELAPWAFKRVSSQADLTAAQRAARSGVEYALARLKVQPAWRGSTTRTVVVDTPDTVIVEEQGNVIGLLRHNGSTSQFRLRFNWQDGGPARDQLPDAPAAMEVQVPLVCYNNLVGSVEMDVPKADGPGYSVPGVTTTHTVAPPFGVYLVCEGRSGDWLNGANSSNPNPALPGLSSATIARVETVFKVNNLGQAVTPAVAASAGTFTATLPPAVGSMKLDSADNGVLGRLRSRKDINFVGGAPPNLDAAKGKQGEFRNLTGATGITASARVQSVAEVAVDELYKIKWADVNQAVATATNQLKGGVYTFWQDGTLHYYDMTLSQYKTFMAVPANESDPGVVPLTLPATVSAIPSKFKITGDTLIVAGTATSDLVIIPKKGVDPGPGAPGGYEATELGNGLTLPSFWDPSGEFDPNDYGGGTNVAGLMRKVAVFNGWSGTQTVGSGVLRMEDAGSLDCEFRVPAATEAATRTAIITDFVPFMMTYLNDPGTVLTASDLAGLSLMGVTGSGGGLSELPLTSPDSTTPQDLEVSFEPGGGQSAVLSGPGNVTLGTKIKGKGGSITAEGNINMVGLGVNLAASTNPNEGVSLYSKKDILISTFDKAAGKYGDVGLKGAVYCWGNLTALLGATAVTPADWGKFSLNGALVAYGKDPDLLTPPTAGKIDITAKAVNLKFDSSYLLGVMSGGLPAGAKLGRVWWFQQ